MRKKSIIAVLFIMLALMVPLASATLTVLFSETGATSTWYQLKDEHVADTADYSAALAYIDNDQANNEYLYSITVFMKSVGSPDCIIKAAIYNDTGAVMPDVMVAESATEVGAGDIMPLGTWVQFIFDDDLNITSDKDWWVGVYVETEVSLDDSNYIAVSDTNDNVELSRSAFRHDVHWDIGSALKCLNIEVVTSDETYATETEDPDDVYPEWTTEDSSELIENAMQFLVPVIVMLLPAVLFVIFFKRTDKWLILIGLAIGVGLGYYFFNIPVWLVFLVAIGLIGLAYSEVRRNG